VRVLSLTATGRLAERIVRKAGEPMPVDTLVTTLEAHDVETSRARAGIQLAVIVGRLEGTTDNEGRQCVTLPAAQGEVA
jgi:hypothetical protein